MRTWWLRFADGLSSPSPSLLSAPRNSGGVIVQPVEPWSALLQRGFVEPVDRFARLVESTAAAVLLRRARLLDHWSALRGFAFFCDGDTVSAFITPLFDLVSRRRQEEDRPETALSTPELVRLANLHLAVARQTTTDVQPVHERREQERWERRLLRRARGRGVGGDNDGDGDDGGDDNDDNDDDDKKDEEGDGEVDPVVRFVYVERITRGGARERSASPSALLQRLQLEYRVDGPLSSVIRPAHLSRYDAIHQRLLQLRFLHHQLHALWKELHSHTLLTARSRAVGRSTRPPVRGGRIAVTPPRTLLAADVVARVSLARHVATHVLDTLMGHWNRELLVRAWRRFLGRVVARGVSVSKLRQLHSQYLREAASTTFVNSDAAAEGFTTWANEVTAFVVAARRVLSLDVDAASETSGSGVTTTVTEKARKTVLDAARRAELVSRALVRALDRIARSQPEEDEHEEEDDEEEGEDDDVSEGEEEGEGGQGQSGSEGVRGRSVERLRSTPPIAEAQLSVGEGRRRTFVPPMRGLVRQLDFNAWFGSSMGTDVDA